MKPFATLVWLVCCIAASGQWSTNKSSNNVVYENILAPGAGAYIASAPDADGGALLSFTVNLRTLLAQKLTNNGAIGWNTAATGVVVCSTGNIVSNQALVADGAGGAFVAWTDLRHSSTRGEIYVQHLNANGAASWTTNGIRLTNTSNIKDDQVRLLLNEDGTLTAGWTGINEVTGKVEVYLQRIRRDGSTAWAANGITVSSVNAFKRLAGMVPATASGTYVVFDDSRNDPRGTDYSYFLSNLLTNTDLYAQRIDSSGQWQWTAQGKPVCTATGLQASLTRGHVHRNNGGNGFTVVFQDTRSGNTDIYAQKTDSTGNTLWTSNGVPVVTETGTQFLKDYTSVVDASGRVYIAYENGPAFNKIPIDLVLLSPDGTKPWSNAVRIDGPSVSIGFTNLGELKIVGDQLYIVYEKSISANIDVTDIYAQKLDSTGQLLFGSSGLLVCDALNNQRKPTLVVSTDQRLISAWLDGRLSIGNMVYASRFDSAGSFASSRQYRFIGSGLYTDAANWQNGQAPPANMAAGDEIIIDPASGECILTGPVQIPPGVKFSIASGKRLRIL